jgi:hypothetical protein
VVDTGLEVFGAVARSSRRSLVSQTIHHLPERHLTIVV